MTAPQEGRAAASDLVKENETLRAQLTRLENEHARLLIEREYLGTNSKPMNFLRNAQDGVFFSNAAGEVIFLNPYLIQTLGLDDKDEQLLGKPLPDTLWEDPAERQNINQDLEQYGQIKDRLVIMRNQRTHNRVYVSLSSVTVRDRVGKVMGAQHMLCNITSKMGLAEELRQRTQLLAVLAQISKLLSDDTPLDGLLEQSLTDLVTALNIPACACIYLKGAADAAPTLVAQYGHPLAPNHPANDSLAVQIIATGEPTSTAEVKGIPMRVHGAVVGALFIGVSNRHRISDSDMEMLQLVAAELALAVENERLRQ